MNHWMSLPGSKQTKCKSYEVVKGAIKEPFTVAKLKFSAFIAGCYLTIYQSQKLLIPFLYDDLQKFYKELLGLTIKSKVLGKSEDDFKELLKIDLYGHGCKSLLQMLLFTLVHINLYVHHKLI